MAKKGGKKGKKAAAEEPAPELAAAAGGEAWVCEECEQDNEADDAVCCACEEPRPAVVDPRYDGYCVGVILEVSPVPGKDKLSSLKVDIGGG